MRRHTRILLTLLLSAPIALTAQELKPSMTLRECVEYAQMHSPQTLSLTPQLESMTLSEQLAKQAFLPNLNAGVSENASFGRSQGKDGVFRDISSANTSFSVSTQMDLFQGGARWWSLQKAKETLKTKDYIIADVMDNIALQTTQDYITLLLSKQMVVVAQENLSLSQQLLRETEQQVEAGKLPIGNRIQIESQVGQARLTLKEAEADAERAMRLLLLGMGVTDRSVVLDPPTPSIEEVSDQVERTPLSSRDPLWIRPATRLAEINATLAEYDIKRAKSAYWPSLSLNAGYSNGYYYNFGDEAIEKMNIPFKDQMNQNGRTFVGVSLAIPIYNRGQVWGQVRQATLQQLNLRTQYIQKSYQDEQNLLLAETDLRKAEEQYRISGENRRLTREALDIADLEYKAGRITTYEWEQAKNKHIQAQAQYVQSIYTRLLRTINLNYFYTGVLDF